MRSPDQQNHDGALATTTQPFDVERLGDCVLVSTTNRRPVYAPAHAHRRAFTLIEIVLTIVMIVMLVGVFSVTMFGTIGGRALDEGSLQFDTMLRLARAEAANNGRRLRLTFSPAVGDATQSNNSSADAPTSTIRFEWEPQPLAQPGEFIPYENGSWTQSLPTSQVIVKQSQLTGESALQTLTYDSELMNDGGGMEGLQPVNFFPDGTTDSARFTLVSTDNGDNRTAIIELDGNNGRIQANLFSPNELDEFLAGQEEASKGNRAY